MMFFLLHTDWSWMFIAPLKLTWHYGMSKQRILRKYSSCITLRFPHPRASTERMCQFWISPFCRILPLFARDLSQPHCPWFAMATQVSMVAYASNWGQWVFNFHLSCVMANVRFILAQRQGSDFKDMAFAALFQVKEFIVHPFRRCKGSDVNDAMRDPQGWKAVRLNSSESIINSPPSFREDWFPQQFWPNRCSWQSAMVLWFYIWYVFSLCFGIWSHWGQSSLNVPSMFDNFLCTGHHRWQCL